MSGKCESGNTLPIDLDKSELVNVSEQLTQFKYNFLPCSGFKIGVECPDWLSFIDDASKKCETGVIKIEQTTTSTGLVQLLNLSTMGNLIGAEDGGNICCYYFPTSLNFYNGKPPNGGEIVIELKPKDKDNGGGDKDDHDLLLLFIPVIQSETNTSSTEWFNEIINNKTGLLPTEKTVSIATSSMSLNALIPKSPYWVYNEIYFHGRCLSSPNKVPTTHAIFFDIDEAITIHTITHTYFQGFGPASTGNGDTHFDEAAYKLGTKEFIDIGNNSIAWKEIWHKKKVNTEKPPGSDDNDDTQVDEEETKGPGVRDFSGKKPNRGSIFRNEQGTKKGPGDNASRSDPFSLTCEPIVDEDDKPIDGKDRLEWVKEIYNSDNKTLQGMKSWFWIFLFVIALTGILMALHVFIFKNIGLFITQNEIIDRADK